jgi:hypothetical protein
MRKGTHIAIVAGLNLLWITLTKLDLIFFRMIEFLNSIVSFLATLTLMAFSPFKHVLANLRLIGTQGSPLILFLVMVEWTPLQVVCVRFGFAGIDLEFCQIQEGTKILVCRGGEVR